MAKYSREWRTHLDSAPFPDPTAQNQCETDLKAFDEESQLFSLGIECLRKDVKLRQAFLLMNRCFENVSAKSNGRIRSWRLFQLGSIISQLPALTARELSKDANDDFA